MNADLRWEPGTLSADELDRVLTDALADVWLAVFDDEHDEFRARDFRAWVEQAAEHATGVPLCGLPEERGRRAAERVRDASDENAPVPLAAADRRRKGGGR